jgi:hypothetical protein
MIFIQEGCMRVVIKEWPNRTATLMTEIGQVVWTFSSAEHARAACREWFRYTGEGGGHYELVAEDLLADSHVV